MRSGNLHISWSELQVGEVLGQGAFATVYKCTRHGKEMAIKIINERPDSSLYLNVNEIRRELYVMRKLEHPNLVNVIGNCIHPFGMVSSLLKLRFNKG